MTDSTTSGNRWESNSATTPSIPAAEDAAELGSPPIHAQGSRATTGIIAKAGIAGAATVLVLGGGVGGYFIGHAIAHDAQGVGTGIQQGPQPGVPLDGRDHDGGFGGGPGDSDQPGSSQSGSGQNAALLAEDAA